MNLEGAPGGACGGDLIPLGDGLRGGMRSACLRYQMFVIGADVADAVRTVVAALAARRGGATINAAAKKAEINYRTALRIVDAAENGRRVGLSAAS